MSRLPMGSWLLSALLVAAVVAVAFVLVRSAEAGSAPPFLASAAGATPPPPPPSTSPARQAELSLAGSGTNLPLTRKLAERFTELHPGQRVVVHDSIGSTGAVHAVMQGAVPIGLVSRPLSSDERGHLKLIPYARVAVVLAAHPSVVDAGVTRGQLLALYRGTRRRWSDGEPAVVLQRERGDSGHRAVERVLPEFAAVNAAAWRERRFRVLYSDGAMEAALLDVPGAVGLFDSGAIAAHALPLRTLQYEGVAPTPQALEARRYPFYKELSFVVPAAPAAPADDARAFVDFVYGTEGQVIIRRYGYLPLSGGRR